MLLVCGRRGSGELSPGAPVDDDVRQHRAQFRLETIAERPQVAAAFFTLLLPEFQGRSHADSQRGGLRAGPKSRLLVPAEQQRRQRNAVADRQGADAQRTAELVRRNAQRIRSKRAETHWQLADDLDGVGVQRHAGGTANRRQIGHGLQHAGVVIA